MKTDHLSHLRAAGLVAKGARLHLYGTGTVLALGAIEWIDGKGLLVAELGAEHQGQVHLIAATRLEEDGPSAVDVYAGENLVGTILWYPGLKLEAWRERLASETWRAFWAAEIATARG